MLPFLCRYISLLTAEGKQLGDLLCARDYVECLRTWPLVIMIPDLEMAHLGQKVRNVRVMEAESGVQGQATSPPPPSIPSRQCLRQQPHGSKSPFLLRWEYVLGPSFFLSRVFSLQNSGKMGSGLCCPWRCVLPQASQLTWG